MTKKELEEQLMKMPELEERTKYTQVPTNDGNNHPAMILEDLKEQEQEEEIGSVEIHQDRPDELVEVHHELRLSSSMVYKDRFCLGGENEEGEYLTIWFDSYEFLKSVNREKLKEIKATLIKDIKSR